MLVLFVITVAACEAAVALAMILMLFRRRASLDIVLWQDLREDNQPPLAIAARSSRRRSRRPSRPHLTPAGPEPEISREATDFRPKV